MRKRRGQQRPPQGETPEPAPAAGRQRRGWRTAIGVLVVAVAIAVIADSFWADAPDDPQPVAPDEAPAVARVVVPDEPPPLTIDFEYSPSQTHEDLTAAMVRIADRLAATFPDDPLVYDLQGRVYAYLGKSAEAARAWQRCLEVEPDRPDACSGLAKLAIKSGDDAAAEPLLRKALAVDDSLSETVQQLAELLTRGNRAEEAVEVLARYVQRYPTAAECLLTLAQTELQLGNLDAAQQHFEAVVALRPTMHEAFLGLGTVLTRQGRREEGRKHLETARTLRAEKPGRPADLSAAEFDMLQTRVSCASSVLYAAQVYQRHGQLPAAEHLARQAMAMDPKSLPSRLLLITLYGEMQDVPRAIQVCEDTVAADPENPDLVWELGVLNFQAGRFEAAESALRKVLHLAPDQARSYEGLAELFLQSGRWDDEAVRLAREAVRLNPAARNYVLLGRLCAMSGDFDAARLALDEALEREPDNGFYRQLREELPALERGRRAKQK